MNRLILKYGRVISVVILVIFAWVIYSKIVNGGVNAIVLLVEVAIVVWIVGAFVFIYFWPRITVGGFKRVFTRRGLGNGPIPVNSIYAVPDSSSQSASAGNVIATGTDDVLYLGGWLDVSDGAQLLQVPDTGGRYYAVQFADPTSGANFAYVGKRTTGTKAGEFLLCERGWRGEVPVGATRIDVPHRQALMIGRMFVANEDDRPAAYALAKQVQLTGLGSE
jgi:hypothetical protein